MDIQKEREDFEKLWTDGNGHFKFFKFDQDDCKYRLNGVTDNLSKEDLLSASITLNTAWLFWLGAKKRAVSEGFVLVEREKLAMIFETATNALVYHEAPPKHSALSIIQGIARKIMIETKEQSK